MHMLARQETPQGVGPVPTGLHLPIRSAPTGTQDRTKGVALMKFSRMREIEANREARKTKRYTKKESAELAEAKAKGQPPATPAHELAARDPHTGMLIPKPLPRNRRTRRAYIFGRL